MGVKSDTGLLRVSGGIKGRLGDDYDHTPRTQHIHIVTLTSQPCSVSRLRPVHDRPQGRDLSPPQRHHGAALEGVDAAGTEQRHGPGALRAQAALLAAKHLAALQVSDGALGHPHAHAQAVGDLGRDENALN